MEDYRLLEPVFDKSEALKALVHLYGIDHALIVDAVPEFLILRTNALNGGLLSWELRSLNADCQRCASFCVLVILSLRIVSRIASRRIAAHRIALHHRTASYRIASRLVSHRGLHGIGSDCSHHRSIPPRAPARHQYHLTQGNRGGPKADEVRREFSSSPR